MRKSSGLMLLLLASAGSAALYALPSELTGLLGRVSSLSSADAQQLPADSVPALDVAKRGVDAAQARVFSPTTPLVEAVVPPVNKSVRLAQAQIRTVESTARPGGSSGFVAPLSADGSRRLASSKPGDDDARRELTRDLQKELKRVGCFDGEINGTWSPASKKAMSAFMDRVNATLPVDDPDYILLTLVQGHAAQACGKGCPSGQGLSADGRCQPRAILAQSARKSDDRKLVDRVEKSKSGDQRTADARAADAKSSEVNGIQTGSVTRPQQSAASSWTTSTTAAAELPKPLAQIPAGVRPAVQAAPQASSQAAPQAAPLPGRMAMGAPVPTPDEVAKLDDIDARKRRAQAALIEEQKIQAKAQTEADRLKAERLIAEAHRRDQQLKTQNQAQNQALALAEAERQKVDRLNTEADRRERQVAAADARRAAQRQADALEAGARPDPAVAGAATTASASTTASTAVDAGDATKVAAVAAAAVVAKEGAERRLIARRAREARDREEQRTNERRTVAAASTATRRAEPRPEPRYVPQVSVARVAPSPTPRPQPEQRWTRTIFSDISRNSR